MNARLALKIDEASEPSNSALDDILHLAELGKLVVYVAASRWRARRVTEIDHSIIKSHVPPTVYLRGPALSEIPSIDDKDFEEKCKRRIRLEQAQDIICGNVIEYGRYGSLKNVYELMFIGLQPISARTFQEYRVNPDSTEILLDLNRSIGISGNNRERLVYPNPKTLVSDALVNRSLFVMAADVKH